MVQGLVSSVSTVGYTGLIVFFWEVRHGPGPGLVRVGGRVHGPDRLLLGGTSWSRAWSRPCRRSGTRA